MDAENRNLGEKDFYENLRKNKVSMAFQGIFSQDILTLLGQSLRGTPNNDVISKRLFAIVVELAQNIHHYSAAKEYSEKDMKEIGIGIVVIGEDNETYTISSGNLVFKKDIEPIVKRSEYINGLNAEELREYYRAQRKAPQREGKPGANLGLIDMVRKSGNPISVDVRDHDDECSFLVLSVKVNKAN